MKTLVQIIYLVCVPIFALNQSIGLCAAFQNLDFESVILPLVPDDPLGYDRVPIASALPFWTAYSGASQESRILHNNIFLDSTGIGIVAPGTILDAQRIEGNYTAFLEAKFQLLGFPNAADAVLA